MIIDAKQWLVRVTWSRGCLEGREGKARERERESNVSRFVGIGQISLNWLRRGLLLASKSYS